MPRTVQVGEFKIAYERAGQGAVVLLLHGIICDSRVWKHQIPVLAKEFTVVAWDAPGCGRSSDPPESFRIDSYADVLAAFMDALELDSAHVVGHSWGATLALALYRRHSRRVASLILANGYAGWKGSLPAAVCAERLESCLLQSRLPAGDVVPSWIPSVLTQAAPKEVADEFSRLLSDFHPVGFRSMAHAIAEADERAVLPKIDVPTLLIWGEADVRAPLSVAQDMAQSIRGAALAVIRKVGHAHLFERPNEFSAEVISFLRRVHCRNDLMKEDRKR